MQIKKIAFLGLGVMGYPMAGHLAHNGYEVCVYNRSQQKARQWMAEYSGTMADSPAKAVQDADLVMTCVANDKALEQLCMGEYGAFHAMKPHSVFIDHTTASAKIAQQLSRNASLRQIDFIDAPVSGGQSGAENAILTIMCGGQETVFSQVEPVLKTYAQKVMLMGPVGSGQKTKMVNQICIGGLLQALSEAMAFAQNAGLDIEQVFDVISKGAAQSWQMENRYASMNANQFDFGFAVKWMRKDFNICFDEADANGSHLPITRMVDAFYAEIEKKGGENLDTSSLITLLTRNKK